jgi:hypothetical protein
MGSGEDHRPPQIIVWLLVAMDNSNGNNSRQKAAKASHASTPQNRNQWPALEENIKPSRANRHVRRSWKRGRK